MKAKPAKLFLLGSLTKFLLFVLHFPSLSQNITTLPSTYLNLTSSPRCLFQRLEKWGTLFNILLKRKEETGRTTASVHNSETEVGRYSI